jgi:hypothetical protein
LVVWNIFFFSIYWECHHPSWRTPSFCRGVGQPPTSHGFWWWRWSPWTSAGARNDLPRKSILI